MDIARPPLRILLVEDDPDDRALALRALRSHPHAREVRTVSDGEELMDYLRGRGAYACPEAAPRPDLILLDLNLPRKDGREALREIKADAALRSIPVVVLTTSCAELDVASSYDAGANAYFTKPHSFRELKAVVGLLGRFWIEGARLPPRPAA